MSRGHEPKVAIVKMDGMNLRIMGTGFQPDWSPNGKTIVFVRVSQQVGKIYRMDAGTGLNLVELSNIHANDRMPTWSPDGKHVAFLSDRVGQRYHLFVMGKNGGGVTQLTDGDYDIGSICWGKDGFIYFSANAGNNWDLWRLKPVEF